MGIIDNLKAAPELKVCMLGPRAVGKTTVMTSIFCETRASIGGTNIYLQDAGLSNGLDSYRNALENAVLKRDASMLHPSRSIEDISFRVGLKNSQSTLNLTIKDYPGEYLEDKNDMRLVQQFLEESSMILLAIDTPFMMEDNGAYNYQKNKVDVVTKFFSENAELMKDKLVLFVPLKCEKYVHEDLIDIVSNAVEKTYSEMINIFRKNNIASIITPILTLGGIEFDRMEDNNETKNKRAIYRSYAKDPIYRTTYCAQPLYYLLTYSANLYEWQKNHISGNIWKRLQASLSSFFKKDSVFYAEIRKLSRFIIHNESGFRQLTTNDILKLS